MSRGVNRATNLLHVSAVELAPKNPFFFAKVLRSQKDFAQRAVPHAQRNRPPIEVVVTHWKK